MVEDVTIKSLVKTYSDNCTTHGVGAIGHSKSKFTRILWMIIFLLLFTYMTFSTYKTIKSYLDFETVTSITIQHNRKLRFPSVTICRNNLVSKEYLPYEYKALIDDKIEKILANGTYHPEMHASMGNISLFLQSAMENHNYTIPDQPNWILSQSKIPDSCMFASKPCNISSDFQRTFKASKYGACYTFNSGNAVRYYQHGSGPYFGLSLLLFVKQFDYIPLGDNKDGPGFTLYLHRPDTYPFLGISGVHIGPGLSTKVAITKKEVLLKPHPYPSNCSNGEGIPNYFPGNYTVVGCRYSCTLRNVHKKCSYADKLVKEALKNKSFPQTTTEMLQCRADVTAELVEETSSPCYCPSACFTELFDTKTSSSRWPTDADLRVFRYMFASAIELDSAEVTNKFVHQNFAKLEVYFDSLSFERLVERATSDVNSLLSDIGGHLGFWTGSSVFSLAELIALLVGICSLLFHRSKQKVKECPKNGYDLSPAV